MIRLRPNKGVERNAKGNLGYSTSGLPGQRGGLFIRSWAIRRCGCSRNAAATTRERWRFGRDRKQRRHFYGRDLTRDGVTVSGSTPEETSGTGATVAHVAAIPQARLRTGLAGKDRCAACVHAEPERNRAMRGPGRRPGTDAGRCKGKPGQPQRCHNVDRPPGPPPPCPPPFLRSAIRRTRWHSCRHCSASTALRR